MNNFVLWGLGVIVGYITGQLSMLIVDHFQNKKSNQKEKQEFLKAQTERMKQNYEKYESKQNK